MKVNIGRYISWYGPYQLADTLGRWFRLSDERTEALGKWLSDSWIKHVLEYIHSKKDRKVSVHIDGSDIWDMHTTLSLVIAPMLRMMKDSKHGAPWVDDKDVPKNIRSTSSKKKKKNEWETDEFFFDRWDYVLAEMSYAFDQIEKEALGGDSWDQKFFKNGTHDKEGREKEGDRIQNGLNLFAKYYFNLWT